MPNATSEVRMSGSTAREGGDARPAPPARVVLADDDVLLREGLAGLLARSGFEVVGQAGDGVALLELVREQLLRQYGRGVGADRLSFRVRP